MRKDTYLPWTRAIWKSLALGFHGSAGYCVCLISNHIGYMCYFYFIELTLPSYVIYIIYAWVAVGNFIVKFYCIGVNPSCGSHRFLLLPWLGWTPWYLTPISSSVLNPLLIICFAPLVPTVISPFCAAWDSSTFGPLSCCWLLGLMLVLGLRCAYSYCGRGLLLFC